MRLPFHCLQGNASVYPVINIKPPHAAYQRDSSESDDRERQRNIRSEGVKEENIARRGMRLEKASYWQK